MEHAPTEIPVDEIARQSRVCQELRAVNERLEKPPLAIVDTYGCQQNESDSEKLRGFLSEMGYLDTEDFGEADVVVINTCAVREHAEMRVLGNVGALTHTKKAKKTQIIVLCGCMVQQEHMAERIKKSFPIVDIVFGPNELWRFPELLLRHIETRKRVFEISSAGGTIAEGLPVRRQTGCRAWLPVMYGCDNFCSYCVVPYVRGRERSRNKALILREASEFIAGGVREITLLGQNVNSYHGETDFPGLLREMSALPGDFLLRFMTSHPKDASGALFRAMAESEKCAKHLHLPAQSGNSRVLSAMNRGYTRESYLEKISALRRLIPDIVLTTDIIVGFPGETEAEFADTLSLIEQVRYDAMFTFIYSRREGTPAADIHDGVPRSEKQKWFDALITRANAISAEKHAAYVGKTLKILVDGSDAKTPGVLTARTNGGRLVRLKGAAGIIGQFVPAVITGSNPWSLEGKITDN